MCHFRLLPDASGPLRHNSEVKFFLGTAEILARVRLLGAEELAPGGEGWLQLELRDPVVAVRGDRYILRRPSPGETLGGGVVVDPQPRRRHKRFDEGVFAQLESLRHGSPADVLLQAFQATGAAPIREAVARSRLAEDQARAGVQELLETGQLVVLEPGPAAPNSDLLAYGQAQWNTDTARAVREVENYHRAYPAAARHAARGAEKPPENCGRAPVQCRHAALGSRKCVGRERQPGLAARARGPLYPAAAGPGGAPAGKVCASAVCPADRQGCAGGGGGGCVPGAG